MKRIVLVMFVLAIGVAPISAQEQRTHINLKQSDLKWVDGPPSLPKGAQMVALEGSPGEEGIFTMRLKLPAGYRISPHWHPAWEHITVIDGSFWMGLGEKFDEAAMHEIPAGGFGAMAPGQRHFAMTKGATIIQLHGMGPWQIIYVDPANDPRTKK